ncbi:uncharacterized protein [Aegilops tauschii subsp. strangulata]|uniref:uncharacterized protein n=1 Tax=Aegilops tauschii subsp. strangulata TaxID=200361 RepID=UPI003CC86F96
MLWRTQIVPQLRGAGVFGYVDGTQPEPVKLLVTTKDNKETSTPNPLHPIWVREDQQVLGYLLSNLTKEVLLTVTTVTTVGALWTTLAGMYSSQSASRINNIRTSLINAQKGNLYVASYFATMRGYADELAAAGKAILDDELISYIIHGLDADYQPLISALDARVTPVTIDELFAMLSNFDQRMVHFHGSGGGGFKSSANSASRGRGGSSRRGGFSRGRGRSSGGAKDCWYRYKEDDDSSQDDEKVVAAADGSYGIDTNWYVDSGATKHITNELEKVTMKEKYRGKDQIHTASGEGRNSEQNDANNEKNDEEIGLQILLGIVAESAAVQEIRAGINAGRCARPDSSGICRSCGLPRLRACHAPALGWR